MKDFSRVTRIFLMFAAALLLVGALWFFFGKKEEKTQYLTAAVVRADVEKTVLATGKLQASRQVDVGAQVSGQISRMNVEIGDTVQKGDVLAQIDPRTQNNQLQVAQAELNNDQAALASARATLQQAQQVLARQKEMFAVGGTSKEALETAEMNVKTAQAARTQAQARIKQAQINVETAKLNLGYTEIVAPIDGTVIAVAVEEGQTVNSGMSTPRVATLAQLDKMTVKAEISEADVTLIQPGMAAYFTLLGERSTRRSAELKSIDPGPLRISDNTLSAADSAIYYYGILEVPNPDGALRIDMTANVVIVLDKAENVPVVPAVAVHSEGARGQRKSYVQVLDENGNAVRREVLVGISDGVNTEIRSGLTEGEKVIIGTDNGKGGGQMPRIMPRA